MGLFSIIGSILGGGSEKKAIKQATKAQTEAMNKAIAEQQRQFDLTRADFAPWQAEGKTGLAQLGDLVGTHGADAQGSAIEALKASPFYQNLFRTGQEAVLQNASATGGLRGGNEITSLANFGSDTLMATIERQLASLGGLAGMGMGATESVANFGAGKANAVSEIGRAYCQNCRSWKRFDVFPGVQSHGLPDFKVCVFCGVWLDEPAEESA